MYYVYYYKHKSKIKNIFSFFNGKIIFPISINLKNEFKNNIFLQSIDCMFIKLKEMYSFVYHDKKINLQNKILKRKYDNNSLHKTRQKHIIIEETPKTKEEDITTLEVITEECYEIVEKYSFSEEDFYHVTPT